TTASAGQFQVGQLSLMVAKINQGPNQRQQTVILQPKISSTRAPVLQMNQIRASTVISSQTNISSTAPSISVRTRVLSGQGHQTSALPNVLNLSTVTSTVAASPTNSTNNSIKQMITGPKFIAGNVETLNFVMNNPNEAR